MKDLLLEQRHEIEQAILNTGKYELLVLLVLALTSGTRWILISVFTKYRSLCRQQYKRMKPAAGCPLDKLHIPQHLTVSIWKKAQDLVVDETTVIQAPGDDRSWCVKSYSCKRPHYVWMAKCSGVINNVYHTSNETVFPYSGTSDQIRYCLDKFVKWYCTLKSNPNFLHLLISHQQLERSEV